MKNEFVVFRDLFKDDVIKHFYKLYVSNSKSRYAKFVASLYAHKTIDWTEYLVNAVLSLDNCLTRLVSENKEIPDEMQKAACFELDILSKYASCVPNDFVDEAHALFVSRSLDLKQLYFDRLKNIGCFGFGDFAKYNMFHIEPDTNSGFHLEPVKYPDPIRLADLIGYDLQQQKVIANTEVLLNGYFASNVLLYGDAGTGKSATVKAIANEYASKGLRLVEIRKDQLYLLPKLLDVLSSNPLKFILFIDDLSFQEDDDDFGALKAVLEGSVSMRSHNTVIYATSNRRHLVKETFQSRAGDEIHRQDQMQETISLSERFGIKVYYEKPKKDLYLEIVDALASQYGLTMDRKELALKAEQFALRKSGRSARAARQLIEQLSAQTKEEKNVDVR